MQVVFELQQKRLYRFILCEIANVGNKYVFYSIIEV